MARLVRLAPGADLGSSVALALSCRAAADPEIERLGFLVAASRHRPRAVTTAERLRQAAELIRQGIPTPVTAENLVEIARELERQESRIRRLQALNPSRIIEVEE
jgi:hypothetical protein